MNQETVTVDSAVEVVEESKELAVVKTQFADILPDLSELSVADQLLLDALAKLEEFRGMVLVTGDKASFELVRRSRLTCRAVRCAAADACKGKREDATKVQRHWSGIEKRLVEHIHGIEKRLEEQEDAEEKRIAEAKKAEAERKQKVVTDRLNSLVVAGLLTTPERMALALDGDDEAWAESFATWKAEHEAAEAERAQREADEKAAREAQEAAERAEREKAEEDARAAEKAARDARKAQEDAERAERQRLQAEADAKAEAERQVREAAALRSRIHSERLRDIVKLDPLAFDRTPEDGTLADLSDAEYTEILLAAKEAGEARQAAARKVQEAQAERRALENSWIKRAADIGVVLIGRDVAEWTPAKAEENLQEIAVAVEEQRKAKERRARVEERVGALASYGCKVQDSFEDLAEEEQDKILAQVKADWEQAKENEKAVEAKDAESVRVWVDSVKAALAKKPSLASDKWICIMEETEAAVLNLLDLSLEIEDDELP